ncbi:MAG: hypothetical protein ACFFAO_10500 [Candidatus Hermodarchaeota archaeon]
MNVEDQNYENFFLENRLNSKKVFLSLFNFNRIPPIVGIILSTRSGLSILTYEYHTNDRNKYGSIDSYLNDNQEHLLDLISMYLSSLINFADNINIENLNNVGIGGSNIKLKVFFKHADYMLIIFLNSNTDLSLRIQDFILDHFEKIFKKYSYFLEHYNEEGSIQIRKNLECSGEKWLKKLNRFYIEAYKKLYIAKDKKFEKFMANIKPLIFETLEYYLKYIPEDNKTDICREIYEKINNELSKHF